MAKTLYFFIALLLGINFWGLIFLEGVFNNTTNAVFALIWALLGFYWFRTRQGYPKNHAFARFNIYFFWLVAGFGLSVISAHVFWDQGWATGIIVNRGLIWYIYIPIILFIQPSAEELMKAIFFYTLLYSVVWVIQAVTPFPIYSSLASAIELGRTRFELTENEFGLLLPGYSVILFLLYYRIQLMRDNPNFSNSVFAFILLIFFFLLQNRGALFFAVIVFGYALITLRSRYKYLLVPLFGMLIYITYLYSAEHWNALLKETVEQFNDPLTNRWRSFDLFLFDYAPHWMCNFLGNGLLSANIPAGRWIQNLMDQGYYQYDNGMLGFWSQYGVIPMLVLYTVIFRIFLKKSAPFFLKAMAAHILVMPIAWNFGSADIIIFVILIYLLAYYPELQSSRVTETFKFRNVKRKQNTLALDEKY